MDRGVKGDGGALQGDSRRPAASHAPHGPGLGKATAGQGRQRLGLSARHEAFMEDDWAQGATCG